MCDHELSFRDKTLVQLDSFFLDLIENILAFVGEKTIRAKFTTIDDIKKQDASTISALTNLASKGKS
jgi:hypothetical protein